MKIKQNEGQVKQILYINGIMMANSLALIWTIKLRKSKRSKKLQFFQCVFIFFSHIQAFFNLIETDFYNFNLLISAENTLYINLIHPPPVISYNIGYKQNLGPFSLKISKFNLHCKIFPFIILFTYVKSSSSIITIKCSMNLQSPFHSTQNNSNSLHNQLLKVINDKDPPQALAPILQVMKKFPFIHHDTQNIYIEIIDKLCDQILRPIAGSIIPGCQSKIEDLDLLFTKFFSLQHHKQLEVTDKNQESLRPYRQLFTLYFHELVHYTTLKCIAKLTIIFYKFVSLQMMDIKIINYYFLCLVLCHENLGDKYEVKVIQSCLRSLHKKSILYTGLSIDKNQNVRKKGVIPYPVNSHLYQNFSSSQYCLGFIAYVVFFGNSNFNKNSLQLVQQDIEMLVQILSEPNEVLNKVLSFRLQYPHQSIFKCQRDIQSLASSLIDTFFIKGLLGVYLNIGTKNEDRKLVYYIIQSFVKCNLNIHTVRNMIKKLEINDFENLEEQWMGVFQIIKTGIPQQFRTLKAVQDNKSESEGVSIKISDDNSEKQKSEISMKKMQESQLKQSLIFKSSSSLKFNLEHQFQGFQMVFRSYRINGQFILLKLKNAQQQVTFVVRHIQQSDFQIDLICYVGGQSTMTKTILQWDPFEIHRLSCYLQQNAIHFIFSELGKDDDTGKKLQSTLKMKNFRPTVIEIGSEVKGSFTYVTELLSFQIPYCQGKNYYNFIAHNKNQIKTFSKNVHIHIKQSFVQILKKLGDLDLFFLITYHLVRKVQSEDILKKMIKLIIDFLQCLVMAKGVSGVKLTQQMKQHRFYNVRCLVWLAAKSKRQPDSIIQILRMLSIRGQKQPLEVLEVFSNIGHWKEHSEKSHGKLMEVIKQSASQVDPNLSQELMSIMRKIMLDFLIFYKNTQLLSENLQIEYLIKHSQIIKVVYDIVITQRNIKIIKFIQFLLKLIHILLDRSKNSDYLDTTLGYEICVLAQRLLFYAREEQYRAQSDKGKENQKAQTKKSFKSITGFQKITSGTGENLSEFNHQNLIISIEQTLLWASENLYCLTKQIKHPEQIKYFDWEWTFSKISLTSSIFSPKIKGNTLSRSIKLAKEDQIIQVCLQIQMGLLTFTRSIFSLLNISQPTKDQWQAFWDLNIFHPQICVERVVDFIKFGHFQTIKWSDKSIMSLVSKTFQIYENTHWRGLPSDLVSSMNFEDPNTIHNFLLSLYLQSSLENNSIEKQKCAERILYILFLSPDSVYTNTALLREELSKQKRNLKTVQLIQKHLLLKQVVKQCFKLVKQSKKNENFSSTITGFSRQSVEINSEQKIQSLVIEENPTRVENFNVFGQDELQSSFFSISEPQRGQSIAVENLRESFEHVKLLVNPNSIDSFYKISESTMNQQQIREQIEAHMQNFNMSIDALLDIFTQICKENRTKKLLQLQNYIFFIQKQIYEFSKMILKDFVFFSNKEIPVEEDKLRNRRKKSLKTVNYKFKEEAENLLDKFLRDRRKVVYKTQNIWHTVQKNNKYFWDIFFKSEKKNQSVDVLCNGLKLRGLIKVDHEKREIELPKNMTTLSSKISVSGADSQKEHSQQPNGQNSKIFQASLYLDEEGDEKQKQQNNKLIIEAFNSKKNRRLNEFPVLYITTTTIYQGVLMCQESKITFIEDDMPDDSFYDLICANENQKRNSLQIEKKKEAFEIVLNEKSTIIPKRYLYHETAVQIFCNKKTYFFVFRKNAKRQHFLNQAHFQKFKGIISNGQKLLQLVNKQTERWMNGDISNFTYLMHLNDLSGRSFNDMSQYYIFPWVLTDYKSEIFDKKFIMTESNYRDLSKPVGALNPKRIEELLQRYKQSVKYKSSQLYLYGSYCSNPAIICNYLVRLQPFSMHHFLLQSKQFDVADRIFYSIANQFMGCYTNIGDYKQLIPQFFSCPQFLRNRNKYKFGEKQNKEIVDDVKLPDWVSYESGKKKKKQREDSKLMQDQFVFRMRKCLQEEYVTKNLNLWIDLIFGIYNKKEKAMEKHNLYLCNIYKNELNKKQSRKEDVLIFYKQFGQLPKDLFQKEHKIYKSQQIKYTLNQTPQSSIIQIIKYDENKTKSFASNRHFFVFWDETSLTIIDKKNKSGLIQKSDNNMSQIHIKNQLISQACIMTAEGNTEDLKKVDFLIYLKQGSLVVRQIGYSTFRKKIQLRDEKESFFKLENSFSLLQIYQDQKYLILGYDNCLKIFQFSLQPNSIQKSGDISFGFNRYKNPFSSQGILKFLINKKVELRLNPIFEFAQHKSKIQHIGICHSYGLLISVDSNRKVFILKIHSKDIEVAQYFRLKKLTNCENIVKLEIHEMGYIVILTSLYSIHMYNFMGDYVACFNDSMLQQINRRMEKKIESEFIHSRNEKGKGLKGRKQKNISSTQQVFQRNIRVPTDTSQSDQENQTSILVANSQISEEQKFTSDILGNFIAQKKHSSAINMSCFKIWNHQSGQIVIGTDCGSIFRVDLFMLQDCEKILVTHRRGIEYLDVERIGRHWLVWAASKCSLVRIESKQYRNAEKRNQQYHKRYVIQ